MALTNAEHQARWRERHIRKRRDAQRIVNLLVRKSLTDDHIGDIEVLVLLTAFLSRHGNRTLRRKLSELTENRASRLGRSNILPDEKQAFERDHPGQDYPEYEMQPC